MGQPLGPLRGRKNGALQRQAKKDQHTLKEKIEKEKIEKEEKYTAEGREIEEKEKEVKKRLWKR